jgi:3-deoxy-manno-octulosonate cytidylyltransferase (CMP-KDO synthetase)
MKAKSAQKKVTAIIPARYGSSRFAGKPLADVWGKPLIFYCHQAIARSNRIDRIIVATDDKRILRSVEAFGGSAILTSSHLKTGTDRLAEVVEKLEGEIFVNVQGDEILLQSDFLDPLIEDFMENSAIQMATYKREILSWTDLYNPNIVKVVTDQEGYALYFSRAPIPFLRDKEEGQSIPGKSYFRHFGVYIYRRDLLRNFLSWGESPLEHIEKLEQLRAMEHGIRILVKETKGDSLRVDTPEDLEEVKKIIKRGHG